MTIIVRNNTPGSDLCKSCRSNIPLGAEATSNSPLYTNRKYLYYKSLNIFQDRLATLPSRPSASEFQHPPYFPPPFAASGPASAASADVFTPVSLQHLQTADPYHVTTSLQNFSPPQVTRIPLSFSLLPSMHCINLMHWKLILVRVTFSPASDKQEHAKVSDWSSGDIFLI